MGCMEWVISDGLHRMGWIRWVVNGSYQMGCIESVISDGLHRMGFIRWVV
jgi:hypothetical protein